MPLFAVFDDARLMKLAQAVKEEVFQGGNVILQKGESGDTMYIIKQGSVRCTDIGHGMTRGCTLDVSYYCMACAGRPTRDIVLEAGKVFGERALLLDEPRAATVTAVTPTVICYSLSKQTVRCCDAYAVVRL